MSLIAGMVTTTGIVMGADSAITDEAMISTVAGKLFIHKNGPEQKDEMLVAYAGHGRAAAIWKHVIGQVKHPDNMGVEEFIVAEWLPVFRDLLEDHGALAEMRNRVGGSNTIFMLGYRDKLFVIDKEFDVDEITEYWADASGQDFMMGALAATYQIGCPPVATMLNALKAANKHCMTTSAPFYIARLGGEGGIVRYD